MKIHRPTPYGKTIRITFSKRNDTTADKRAITIVEATKKEVVDTIKHVYEKELIVGNSKRSDFLKVTVQILYGERWKRHKDEFSFRLYRCDVSVIDRLISYIDSLQVDLKHQISYLLDECRKKALASGNWSVCAQDFYVDVEMLIKKQNGRKI